MEKLEVLNDNTKKNINENNGLLAIERDVNQKENKRKIPFGKRKKENNNQSETNNNLHINELPELELDLAHKQPKKNSNLKISFLGGVGEIGKNMTVLEYGNDIVVIDCGLMFPSDDMLGIDLVVPDISYLIANKNKIRGFVITHGHEDHIGSIPFVFDQIKAPIYGSKTTTAFINRKLEEHKKITVKTNACKPNQKIRLGVFEIEFIHVNHNIPGAFGLAIKTPVGVLMHTGDFNIDYSPVQGDTTDINKFAEYGNKGVLALLADSTNAKMPGYTLSESVVSRTISDLFAQNSDRRIIVATFASNLHRLQEIMNIAEKNKRKVIFTGRSMINNTDTASKIGEIVINKQNIIEIDKAKNYQDHELCIISTGSQGEPMSALTRMANSTFKGLQIGSNDTIIFSSSPIPGNEKDIINSINNLMGLGAKLIYNELADVHASGHAKREELKLIHSVVKPKYFIPVHGEVSHLIAHKELAMELGLEEKNIMLPYLGLKIELNKNILKEGGTVPYGTRLIDGAGVGNLDSKVIKDRKQLSEDGLIIVILKINAKTNKMINRPEIMSRGFAHKNETDAWLNDAREHVKRIVETTEFANKDYQMLRMAVKKGLMNYLTRKMRRRPLVVPIIIENN